ncbi:MAG: zf-HC2 domain-containing protein [Planctomycetes bacterium]|nr:zf-HC2 domain-containing protein [Planctomycetota bacterium]
MSTHLTDEQVVEYLDGTLATPVEQQARTHLADCSDCRIRLADLAQFDGFVQSHQPQDEVAAAAMFEISERVIAARAPRRGFGFGGLATMLAAAVLLVATSLWMMSGPGAEGLGLRITRYVPDGGLRSAPPERFHLDLKLAEPGFVAAFARLPDGKVEQLLPAPGTSLERQAAGEVRLPANELLDWEYPADQLPREVLVVVGAVVLDAERLVALRAEWLVSAPGQLPSTATVGLRAQVLPFPPGR